jgi:hypothetical protein
MNSKIEQIVFKAIKETTSCKYLPKSLCIGAIDMICYQSGIILTPEERLEAEQLMIKTLQQLYKK